MRRVSPDPFESWCSDLFRHAFTSKPALEMRLRTGSSVADIRSDHVGIVPAMLRAFATARDSVRADFSLAIMQGLPQSLASRFPWTGAHLGARGRVVSGLPSDIRACINLATQDATFWSSGLRAGVWIMPPLMPEWHWSSPLRQLLHNASAAKGAGLIHAAMIGDDYGCVLVGGPSHSGKSTTVAMALASGFQTGGDDYVEVVRSSNRTPVAYPIYRMLKIRHGNDVALPKLVTSARTLTDCGKDIYYLEHESKLVLDGARQIKAVVTLARHHLTDLQQTPSGHAVLQLAPSTVTQSVYDEASVLAAITYLCESVPTVSIPRPSNTKELRTWLTSLLCRGERDQIRQDV